MPTTEPTPTSGLAPASANHEPRVDGVQDVLWDEQPDRADPTRRRVLILNASFEPLHVCTVRRAIHLLMMELAVRVDDADDVLRTPSTTVAIPNVVRLARYVRRPRVDTVAFSRRNLLRRDEHRCQYCGRTEAKLTIDHVTPRSRGGQTTWTNVVACCVPCNARKRDRTPQEAGMTLATPPRAPVARFTTAYGLIDGVDPSWTPYVGSATSNGSDAGAFHPQRSSAPADRFTSVSDV